MPKFKSSSPNKPRVVEMVRSREKVQLSNSGVSRLTSRLIWNRAGYQQQRFRTDLYRFLKENIPLLSGCIWTWSRLSSAPSRFEILEAKTEAEKLEAEKILKEMALRVYPFTYQKLAGLESFLPFLFDALYTDGAFAGFAAISSDQSGVERFIPLDVSHINFSPESGALVYQTDEGEIKLNSPDFYYLGLNADIGSSLGKSIMSAVPFVAYIEQQLVDDMRRTTHNAGYHRLHVKITPPEKMAGEADESYINRVNSYFDDTVSMIKECDVEDNPVTWDNVKIEYIGPANSRSTGSTWFLNHRAMVEEICAGTNLAPFMLGYSYGTTHNWAQFKYNLVMRQVLSVQRQTARFLEWLGNIELGLKGFDCKCRFLFENTFSYLASEKQEINKSRTDNLIRLYESGLISKERAEEEARGLI